MPFSWSSNPRVVPGYGSGVISNDYGGSYEEWVRTAAISLAERYSRGTAGEDWFTSGIGRPDPADYNNDGKFISDATYSFFTRYVQEHGASDPDIVGTYGAPPARHATTQEDPNSPSSQNAANNKAAGERQTAANASAEKIAAGNNATDIATANIAATAHITGIGMQVAGSWREAMLADATRRYVAEGEWGTQKYIAELQNTGANSRLTQQIAADKALADQADATRRWQATGDWQTQRDIANLQETGATNRLTMQLASDKALADQASADRRFIAEGDWRTQKEITATQEAGMLARLQLQLGDNDKTRAQNAIAEQNRHHENMLGLVMEVAKYDAELSSQPRNWIAYATWLQNRDVVVNGLTLAMAADLVPATAINPAEVANTTGDGVAAIQTDTEATAAATNAQTGGTATATGATNAQTGATDTTAATTAAQTGTTANTAGQGPYQIGGVDLNSTDYAGIARQLLGMNGAGATQTPTTADLQSAYDALNGGRSNFGGGDIRTNALGMRIQASGAKEDYRQFSNLLPAQQEMKIGAVQSVGKTAQDYLAEMERSRPKGGAVGAASYG